MKQSRLASFLESCGNTLSGFVLGLICQITFLPILGVHIDHKQNFIFALIMTVVSVVRSFGWRRLMEALHVRRALSPFMQAVVAERFRQIEAEGWSFDHDDEHSRGELARAGAAYLLGPKRQTVTDYEDDENAVPVSGRLVWPWDIEWWKPQDFRRDLVRGCALAIAEGERFDRLKTKKRVP
jgi:hypothetical protein